MPGAGGGAGKEVGRISIRVVPDMDRFWSDLKEKIEAAEKSMKAEVPIEADAKGFREDVRAKTSDLPHAKVKVDADTDLFQKRILADLAKIHRDTEAKIPVTFEGEAFRRDLDRVTKQFRESAGKPIEQDIDLATGQREKMLAQVEALKLLAGRTPIKIKMELDEKTGHNLAVAARDMAIKGAVENRDAGLRLREAIQKHAPTKYPIELKLDDKFDYELRNRLRKISQDAAKSLEKDLANIGGGGGGRRGLPFLGGGSGSRGFGGGFDILPNIGGLGGIPSLVLIISLLSLLAPALSLVSQALIGLPALVAAVALPIGVFALGLGGIKKALDNSGLMDLVTGKKGKTSQEIGAPLKKMQEQISDVFEKGFTPLFTQIAAALPALTAGLPFVAKGIVDIAGGLTRAVTRPQNIALFDRFTNSVSTMLTNLAPGLESFSTGIFKIITNVGDHLPGLGTTMSGWADRFNRWIDDVSRPMKDANGIDIANSSTLDQAVSNMKPILNDFVGDIGSLVDAGVKLASSPEMTKNIQDTINGLTNLILNSLPALNSAFDKLAGIFRQLGLANDGEDPGKNAGKTIDAHGAIINIPDPKKTPGAFLPGSGNTVLADGTPIRDVPTKGPLVPLSQLLDHPELLNNQQQSPTFGQEFSVGLGALSRLPDNIDKWGADLKQSLIDALKSAPQTLWNDLGKPGEWLRSLFSGGAGPTGNASADTTTFNPGPKVGEGVGGADIAGAAGQAKGAADGIAAAMGALPGQLQGVWEAIVAGATTAFAGIVNVAAGAVQQIIGTLQGLGPAGVNAGVALGGGMAAGIAQSAPSAIAAAQALAQGVEGAVKGHLQINSPSKLFEAIGIGVGEGFDDGLNAGWQGVLASAQNLSKQVSDQMAQGVTPDKDKIAQSLKAIQLESDQLRVQRDALDKKDPQRKVISDELRQLSEARNQLKLQRDQLGETDNKNPQDVKKDLNEAIKKMIGIGTGFATANEKQFLSDIGASGNGAVEKVGDFAMSWGTSLLEQMISNGMGLGGHTTIQVQSPEDAVQTKATLDNRRSLQYAGR